MSYRGTGGAETLYCQQTLAADRLDVHRVPSSHVICIVTCGGDRKEPFIEKVETGLEYSSGKGPRFDPLAPQKTEEARRGKKAEGG